MLDFTGFGWIIFWVFALAAAGAALWWSGTLKRRTSSAPQLYTDALRALVEGDDQLAFERLKATVSEDSNNLDAYIKLGDLLRKRGHVERAIRVHEDLTLRLGLPPKGQIAVHQSLALDHIAAEAWRDAESSLRKILSLDDHHLWAREQLVAVLERSKRYDDAYEVCRNGGGRGRDQVLARLKTLEAGEVTRAGRPHDARVLYKDALKHDDHHLAALLGIGDAYRNEGRLDDAVEWWTRYAETAPKDAHVIFDRLERALFELGQFGEITAFYDRILESDPSNTAALVALGDLALKKGERETAQRHYRQALDINPNDLSARAGLIRILAQQKRFDLVGEEIEGLLASAAGGR
ncbi:MAG TPA: tetratricopeptide repeat protein [candidate division Zixibacteria bacterium]|jgi:lipopolysaccharide biosynthesis regulator YciM